MNKQRSGGHRQPDRQTSQRSGEDTPPYERPPLPPHMGKGCKNTVIRVYDKEYLDTNAISVTARPFAYGYACAVVYLIHLKMKNFNIVAK